MVCVEIRSEVYNRFITPSHQQVDLDDHLRCESLSVRSFNMIQIQMQFDSFV